MTDQRTSEAQPSIVVALKDALRATRLRCRPQEAMDAVVWLRLQAVELAARRIAERTANTLHLPVEVTDPIRREAAWELLCKAIETLRPSRELMPKRVNAALDALPDTSWPYDLAVPREAYGYMILKHAYIWRDCTMLSLTHVLNMAERTVYYRRLAAIGHLAEVLLACEQALLSGS